MSVVRRKRRRVAGIAHMVRAAIDLGRLGAIAEARTQADADARRALGRLDPAHHHDRPIDAIVMLEARREVDDLDFAAMGVGEGRGQDRGVAQIAAGCCGGSRRARRRRSPNSRPLSAPSSSLQKTGSPSKRGTQAHTTEARSSISTDQVLLPMMPRLRLVMRCPMSPAPTSLAPTSPAPTFPRPVSAATSPVYASAIASSQSRSAATDGTRQSAALAPRPTLIERPPSRLTAAKPSSSVKSSPI